MRDVVVVVVVEDVAMQVRFVIVRGFGTLLTAVVVVEAAHVVVVVAVVVVEVVRVFVVFVDLHGVPVVIDVVAKLLLH